jgi:RNA polymerase sigma factor (sigma-70 family)
MIDTQDAILAWTQTGCQRSAEWFVNKHQHLVKRIISSWFKKPDLMEEVVQETFIKAFKNIHRLQAESNIEAWLCRIARNTCSNYLRAIRRNVVRPVSDYNIDNFNDMIFTIDTPMCEDQEVNSGLQQLLANLQQSDRLLLTMFHLENRSARDVGQTLGISEGNVRVRLMRSHRVLRQQATRMRSNGLI